MSHWENNYGGAVKRLNAITAQLAALDFPAAPVFVVSGLKREELIATNLMIMHAGWVLLAYSPRDRKLVNRWAADHTHSLAGSSPILALDMYEHSYHLDYGAGGEVRRCVHGQHQLDERRASSSGARAMKEAPR